MPGDWLLVALRFALYADLMALFGVALFGIHSMRPDDRTSTVARRYVQIVCIAAVLGIALSWASMIVMAQAMSGSSDYAELTGHVIDMIEMGTSVGVAWATRLAALLAVVVALAWPGARPAQRFVTASAAGSVALATLAWTGHGAMDEGVTGGLHVASDIVHLFAAGAWVGALVAFVVLSVAVRGASPGAADMLGRASNGFARTGTVLVAIVVVTGGLNYLLIVGPTVNDLFTTAYGGLLLVKLALFGMMLALAAANRYRLSPRLARALQKGDHTQAAATLRMSLFTETCLALLILALVAWLGVLPPAGS